MDTTRFEIDEQGTARLQTSKGVLMLDAADLKILEQPYGIKWHSSNGASWYACLWTYKRPRTRIGLLSRLIMRAPAGTEVDHINHDTLDNRRVNLRVCDRHGNARNSSKQRQTAWRFKGVYYHPAKKYDANASERRPWRAYTRVNGKRIWLGYHATDVEAAMAYNRFANAEFGSFACFNRFDTCPVRVLFGT